MKVHGIARFTKELELKQVGDNKLLKTSVAWNDFKGNGHFHNIVAWNKTAERMADCNKGDRIYIKNGTLENNNYQGKDGMVYQNIITVQEFEYIESKRTKEELSKYTQTHEQKEAQSNIDFSILQEDPNGLHKKKHPVIDVDDSLPF